MSITQLSRGAFRKFLFGDTLIPQEFFLGLPDPQTEIGVWLHGMGAPIDVTLRHSMACAAPLVICIAFDEANLPRKEDLDHLSLLFCEQNGHRKTLGEIALKFTTMISVGEMRLGLFEVRASRNWCVSNTRLWIHYLYHAYSERRRGDTSAMKMSFLEKRAAMVMFIRPHPVSLVSLVSESGGNIFPMNIMGDLGNGYFAFALKDSKVAAHLVERARRVALSSIPLSQTSLAYQLGANHRKQSIEWNELPFATRKSAKLHIPVPTFAQRVREMEVETVRKIGSHIFFVARIVSDEHLATGAGLCIVHGFYQAWRLKGRRADLEASLAEDMDNKRGVPIDSLPL